MSLQNLATQMAAQGRGPDRTLVHMSPREVQGLQALAMAHGGSLTINPETGLPEAGFLENMLPAIAGFALNAFAPSVGTAVGGLFGLGEAAGTALTVGGIAGLTSGSLEKGIMAGMGAYGGAGLGASLQNSGATALTKAGVDAAGGAEALGGDASSVSDTVAKASAFDKIKAGAGAAFSQPKDFLQDNKMNLALLTAPALMGTFDDKTVLPAAQATKKYNMNYVKDPVTGALYDTSGEGVTYGGVGRSTRGMAEGGIVPYDTRTDSQKALDYLMGKPGATNPMLFTHETASEAIKPADFATRTGGKYILDAATNTYVWVPDAAAPAASTGIAGIAERIGGGGREVDQKEQDRINNLFDSYASQDKVFGLPPGTTVSEARAKDFANIGKFIMSPLSSIYSFAKDAFMGPQPKSLAEVTAGLKDAKHDESEGPLNTDTSGGIFGYSVSDNNDSVGRSADVADAADAADAADSAADAASASDSNGPSGDGDGPSGDAKGGFYKNGKFNFHPAQVYANGGIAALAGGGLGSLGGYSDGGQLLRGPGNGTSDDIPARIGRNQPARLADGEFVIPSRIVSELGNGSTNAGARELYKMMDRIQAARRKTTGKNKVAFDAKARKHLPA